MFHSYVKLLKGRPPDLDSNKKNITQSRQCFKDGRYRYPLVI